MIQLATHYSYICILKRNIIKTEIFLILISVVIPICIYTEYPCGLAHTINVITVSTHLTCQNGNFCLYLLQRSKIVFQTQYSVAIYINCSFISFYTLQTIRRMNVYVLELCLGHHRFSTSNQQAFMWRVVFFCSRRLIVIVTSR